MSSLPVDVGSALDLDCGNVERFIERAAEAISSLETKPDLAKLRLAFLQFREQYLFPDLPIRVLEVLFGGLAASHQPELRVLGAQELESYLPASWARDIVLAMSIDPDDIVCLEAMRIAGQARLEELAPYLISILGRPSTAAVESSVSPVGRGAAIASRALLQLLDTDDEFACASSVLRAREDALLRGESVLRPIPDAPASFKQEASCKWLLDHRMPTDESMVLVKGGVFPIGLEESRIPDKRFDWARATPVRHVWLPPFLIDRTPVTIAAYDEWCASPAGQEHPWCHPREDLRKDHRRNTALDPRVTSQHPVSGIDWFDAVAFGRSSDKELPTEYQWEAAARGLDRRIWPWGDHWSPIAISCFSTTFDATADVTIHDWERALRECRGRDYPKQTTLPVDRPGPPTSPYGLVDMCGNVWEWTRTELSSRGPFSPALDDRRKHPVSVVIKGGCWASLPGQLYPSFRGQDAPFCRHDEIGFRCVRQIPIPILRTFVTDQNDKTFPWQCY